MRGSQEPRLSIEPIRIQTDGADAGLLMAEYGDELDEWQQSVIDCWLGKSKAGKFCIKKAWTMAFSLSRAAILIPMYRKRET